MTYSRPSGVNPPNPLKQISSRRGGAGGVGVGRLETRDPFFRGDATADLFHQGSPGIADDGASDRLEQNLVLEQLPVTGVILIPDHQVHHQPLQTPVRMGLNELS